MTLVATDVTVTAAPTLLYDPGNTVETMDIVVQNVDAANDVDLGGPTVTSGGGFPLKHGAAALTFHLRSGDKLYGIAAATKTAVVSVLVSHD